MTQSEVVGAVLLALALVGLWVMGREVYAWFWKRAAAREQSSYRIGTVDLLESTDRIQQLLLARLAGPEHIRSLDASCQALTAALKEATPGLAEIGRNTFLIGRGTKDLADQVAYLRSVVFGSKRAEEFPGTENDAEAVRRANFSWEVENLVHDHGLSRPEAEKRVRDMFSTISR